MLCDISMAYPRNISVDATHDVAFKFIFYGDRCDGADLFIYDRDNPDYVEGGVPFNYLQDSHIKYYNGEEVTFNTLGRDITGRFVNNKSYMWMVRIYEHVDIPNGVYPSVIREKVQVVNPPFIFGTIQSYTTVTDPRQIPLETKLELTPPMYIRIGSDETVRTITSYDPESGMAKIDKLFPKYPDAGSDYSISSVKSYVPNKNDLDGKICIPAGISSLNYQRFNRYIPSGSNEDPHIWFAELNGDYRCITGYDYKLGLLKIDGTFPSEIPVGTNMNIWCSFVDSSFFAVDTKPTPYLQNTKAEFDAENLHFTTELATNHTIKKYWWEIYEDGKFVERSDDIYMGKLDYYFKKVRQGKSYRGVVHIVTQDNMVNQEDSSWWAGGNRTNEVTVKIGIEQTKCIKEAFALRCPDTDSIQVIMCDDAICESTTDFSATKNMHSVNIGYQPDIDEVINQKQLYIKIGTDCYTVSGYSLYTGTLTLKERLKKSYPENTPYIVYSLADIIRDDLNPAAKELTEFNVQMQKTYGLGSVDLTTRPIGVTEAELASAGYETHYGDNHTVHAQHEIIWVGNSTTGHYASVSFTPILIDGSILRREDIVSYLRELGGTFNLVANDSKHIILRAKTLSSLKETVDAYLENGALTDGLAEELNETEAWNQEINHEQNLWYEIVRRVNNDFKIMFRIIREWKNGETSYVGEFNSPIVNDYLTPIGAECRYFVIPYSIYNRDSIKEATFFTMVNTNSCAVESREVAIYGLVPKKFVKISNDKTIIRYSYQKDDTMYSVDEFWGASLDMDRERGVTQNLNSNVLVGNIPKPVAVIGNNNYDTFSLTFTLGRVICSGERIVLGTIDDIKRWKNFVAKRNLVLIKAPDGEMWACYLTSHSYTKVYSGSRVEYKVTVEFTDIKPIDTMRVAE